MTFTPLTLDGQAAARRMLDWGTYPQHRCLQAVFEAFPFAASDAPGAYTSARIAWERTPASRRRTDRNPPAGAVVYFHLSVSTTVDPNPGHICISRGGGKLATTDWPERGQVGTATIAEIERKWNARYLGWTDVIGGHNVITAATKPKEQDMTLTATQAKQLDQVHHVLVDPKQLHKNQGFLDRLMRNTLAQNAANGAAIIALAKANGADPKVIEQIVRDAVTKAVGEALDDVEITLTTK